MAGSTDMSKHERAWENLTLTYLTLQKARQLELAKVGLTIPQRRVLSSLKTSEEPLTPVELARRMRRHPHAVSQLVIRMETQGLVKTTKDLHRKNWIRVSLTKKGEAAFNHQPREETVQSATSCLSEKELDMLNATCKKLHARGVELIRQLRPDAYGEPIQW